MKHIRFSFLIIMMIVLSNTIFAQDNWELAKDKYDIQIYTKGAEHSKAKHHKGIAIVDASHEQVFQAMIDVEKSPDWVYQCKESRILEIINDTVLIYYTTFKAPWPATDRDLVTKLTYYIEAETGHGICIYEAAEGYLDLDDDYVRITEHYDITTIVPVNETQVKVIMEGYTDPGGNIPAWIANMFVTDGPYESMIGLKEIFGWKKK